VLTRVAGPLDLGTMYQAHFVADLGRWIDIIERRRVEGGATTMTAGQVRRWLEGADTPAERRGLTPEVADLIILLVAAATDRALVSAGQPVGRVEIGKVRDDWELRAQDLPGPQVWDRALERAEDMGAVPTSRLLSATSVADLGQKIHVEIVGDRAQAVRDLLPRLEVAYARLALDTSGDRLRTAKAAVELTEDLRRRPDNTADALASVDVPTSAAALGTSIKQASRVADELQRTNWDLLKAVGELGDAFRSDADSILARLREALTADELAIALIGRLHDASAAATELLARATRVDQPTPPPPPAPPPIVRLDRALAEQKLEEIRDRLRAEAHLDLTWQIEDLADGES